jgi:hypothetical protein
MVRNNTNQSTSSTDRDTESPHRHLNFDPYKEVHEKLKIDGENYLTWKNKMRRYAVTRQVDHTIISKGNGEPTTGTVTEKAFMCNMLITHMDEGLQEKFMDDEKPESIWKELENKYEDILNTQSEKIRVEWFALKVHKCEDLTNYETKLNLLVRKMKLCGWDTDVTEARQIRKTIDTIGDLALSHTLRLAGYTVHSKLMNTLREYKIRDEMIKDSDAADKRREVAEAHHINTKYQTGRNPNASANHQIRFNQTRTHPYRRDTPRGKRPTHCFACGEEGHISRYCSASQEKRNTYRSKYQKGQNQIKEKGHKDTADAEVNCIEYSMGSDDNEPIVSQINYDSPYPCDYYEGIKCEHHKDVRDLGKNKEPMNKFKGWPEENQIHPTEIVTGYIKGQKTRHNLGNL